MKITSISKLNAKIAISIATAGAIISIAFVRSPAREEAEIVSKKKVAPPLKHVDVEYSLYAVAAAESSTLHYGSGSVISIPANAFVDSRGKPVEGMVDIKYREFHDPADFFVSGIPMTYDSAGTQYHFESAGMLEILAFREGKPVFINPDKKIVVEMASRQEDDKYNIYRFDSVAGNWQFVYKDKASGKNKVPFAGTPPPVLNVPVTASMLAPNTTGIVPEPVKPVLAGKENYQFNLDVDLGEFPEIAVYKNIQFEVKAGEKGFNKTYASVVWNDVSLEKNNKGSYLMTLAWGAESHTFEVNPVFDAASYETAYRQYSKLLAERKKQDAGNKRKNDSLYSLLQGERKFQNDLAKSSAAFEAARMQTEDIVQRVFIISGFGIWNSDCPAKLPQGEQFAATYTDSTGKKLSFKTLYLVEKGRNAMFAITGYTRLYYDPSKKNILWAVTSDNKLAILEEDRFKRLKKKNDSCTVQMKVIAKEITKTYEVRQVLNF